MSTNPSIDSGPVIFADRYVLRRRLAVGGMAEIFLAGVPVPFGEEKNVVIKLLKPELAGDSRFVELFSDEARLGVWLSHPSVVQVFETGEHAGVPFIVMEYISGFELSELCRRGLRHGDFLPLEHAVELVRQTSLAMGYFHNVHGPEGQEFNTVHCDISPNNLLVTHDGFAKVIDFGIAQFEGQSYRDERVVPGKLAYMSPEQATRKVLDCRSDIFSLGIVLYEMTVGRRLLRGAAEQVLEWLTTGNFVAPTDVSASYPVELESIVMKALALDPDERFQSAYGLAEALQNFLHKSDIVTGPLQIARYLDRLAVAAGESPRGELTTDEEPPSRPTVPRELKDDVDPSGKAGDSWEDVDEGAESVAEALGINAELVRAGARATDSPGPVEEPTPSPEAEGRLHTADASEPRTLPLWTVPWLIGVLLGALATWWLLEGYRYLG